MKFKRGDLVNVTVRGIVIGSEFNDVLSKEQTEIYIPDIEQCIFYNYAIEDKEIISVELE